MKKKAKGLVSALFGTGGLYIASALAVLAVGAVGYMALSPAEEDLPPEENTLPVSDAAVISENIPQDISEVPPTATETEHALPTVKTNPVELPEVHVEPVAPTVTAQPLQGDVVAAFSMDALAYNPTTDDWRAHNGIDISAGIGSEVCAACDGTVLSVTDDALMGITVTIEGADGYVTTYSNLASEPPVSENDAISAGDVIGLVGATSKIEASAPPHLHFSVFKNGEAVDPSEYLSH